MMLDRLQEAWTKVRSVMVQMPTGTGKTIILADVVRQEMRNGKSGGILIVAHRRELIDQIRQTIAKDEVVVTSIQKLSKNLDEVDIEPQLVIVDEAHHAVAKTYRMLWEKWPEARFLGLTATPCRLNGAPFTDLFDTLLQSWSIQEFIEKGWLSDFEYVSAAPDSEAMRQVASLHKRGADGDYQTKEMATVMDVPESVAHLYRTYRKFVDGKKGIVYAIDRQHAQHIAEYYQQQGVQAAVIDAKTPAEERRQLVWDYRNNGLKVLINVDIFSEGFDCPEVEFIQLARPTLSLSKYLQQVGRGMRISEGKEAVTILDNVGLYQTFGLPTDERDWRLMFNGKMAGKGVHGQSEQPIIIREGENEKELLNLEMVRIKRRKERHEGIEVFMLGGKYGIMVDGKETCRAEYEHIRRIHDGNYYAIATYPYAVFKGKSTIINLKGMDMRASLYGKVTPHGDIIEGETLTGQRTYWDGIGLQYYDSLPEFEKVGGVEMVCRKGKYLLRHQHLRQKEPVGKQDIWYNKHILWMKNILVVKKTGQVYPIAAYGPECFYVLNEHSAKGRYLRIELNGKITAEDISYLGWYVTTDKPYWGNSNMVRASSGKI